MKDHKVLHLQVKGKTAIALIETTGETTFEGKCTFTKNVPNGKFSKLVVAGFLINKSQFSISRSNNLFYRK